MAMFFFYGIPQTQFMLEDKKAKIRYLANFIWPTH